MRRSTRGRGCSGSAIRAARRSTGSRATATPEAYRFPVARVPGLDLSFSGLKTALLYTVRDLGEAEVERRRADLAASYQRAIVHALVGRLRAAAEQTGHETLAVVGGVAANSELSGRSRGRFAPLALCTDNAAMVASAARFAAPSRRPATLRSMRTRRAALASWRPRSRRSACSPPEARPGRPTRPSRPRGGRASLGSRPLPQLGGQRWVVVFARASLADRFVARAARATELQMRSWTATARAAQRRAIAGLWSRGAPVDPEQSVRPRPERLRGLRRPDAPARPRARSRRGRRLPGARGLPGGGAVAALDTEAFGPQSGRRVEVGIPGADGPG